MDEIGKGTVKECMHKTKSLIEESTKVYQDIIITLQKTLDSYKSNQDLRMDTVISVFSSIQKHLQTEFIKRNYGTNQIEMIKPIE